MLAIIGCGWLGTEIAEQLIKKKILRSREIIVTRRNEKKLKELKNKLGVQITTNNKEAVSKAETIILAVRPQQIAGVLKEIKPVAGNKLFISIAGGLDLKFFESFLPGVPLSRVMPNPLISSNGGSTGYSKNKFCNSKCEKEIKTLFEPLCENLVEVKESQMNTFTTIASCSSSLFYYTYNSLIELSKEHNFDENTAKKIILLSAKASAEHAIKSNESLSEMINEACTPGGMTIDGINYLNEKKVNESVKKAAEKIIERAEKINSK